MGARIRCVIADDHPPIVDSVSRALEARDFEIVARVFDGLQALAAIRDHRPDVALVDVKLPAMSGLDVAREVTRTIPETRVVLYTGAGDAPMLQEAIDSGARGFVVKTASLDEVAQAIESAAGGGIYLDPVLTADLTREAAGSARDLTQREREVLRLLADGLDYGEIGKRLYLSPETIRVHVRRAMDKLEAGSRTHAVAEAIRQRLIT